MKINPVPKTIVLAEDDPEDVLIFSELMTEINADIELTIVENGLRLMNLLEATEVLPDLIFIDINMPLKNGLQCLKEIKSAASWKDIRTIILSTSSHPEQIEESYRNGAALYIKKPNSYTEFKIVLEKCVTPQSDSAIKAYLSQKK